MVGSTARTVKVGEPAERDREPDYLPWPARQPPTNLWIQSSGADFQDDAGSASFMKGEINMAEKSIFVEAAEAYAELSPNEKDVLRRVFVQTLDDYRNLDQLVAVVELMEAAQSEGDTSLVSGNVARRLDERATAIVAAAQGGE